MKFYILRRLIYAVITLFIISIISFVIIQLPPGDATSIRLQVMQTSGTTVTEEMVAQLKADFGLDKPIIVQYFVWLKNMLQGNFGESFYYGTQVSTIIKARFPNSLMLSSITILLVYAIAITGGIISALKQRTVVDYSIGFVSFLGISIPPFLFAIILMYVFYKYFGISTGGFYSPEFQNAAWSMAKFSDLVNHLWPPVLVLSSVSIAFTIRVVRASLLDELNKQYVQVARSKGIPGAKVILKYPTRVALNPVISTVGYILPAVISSETIVGYVMNLPTMGPVLLTGALSQDMFLVGAIVMVLSALTVAGTLVSDLLLALTDPRIRYE